MPTWTSDRPPGRPGLQRHPAHSPRGPWRPAWGVLAGLSMLVGCASQLEIRPMATGQLERPAFELTGSDVAALRREAQKLCVAGADIVRQASAGQRPEAVDGRLQRWWNKTSAVFDPPVQQAQLVVVCLPDATRSLASLAPLPASAASASGSVAEPVAAAPIGPLMPEW